MNLHLETLLTRPHSGFGWIRIAHDCPASERERLCCNRASLLGVGRLVKRNVAGIEKVWSLTGGFKPKSDYIAPDTDLNWFGSTVN